MLGLRRPSRPRWLRRRREAGEPVHPLVVRARMPWHSHTAEEALEALASRPTGLDQAEVEERLVRLGANVLPEAPPLSALSLFLRQFRNPFIYALLGAALIAAAVSEWLDAAFIAAVLVLNAVVGLVQELQAQTSAAALKRLLVSRVTVIRDSEGHELPSTELVPGDIVLLESGMRVPADLRLLRSEGLEVDESALTGESAPVVKQAQVQHAADTLLAERTNMAFAGTMVTHGRASGLVTATAQYTEVGGLAASLTGSGSPQPPLMQRMQRFTYQLGAVLALLIVLIMAIQYGHGTAPAELLLAAVALAVSAVPEGLPVALTVALAVGVNRMARRGVVVRKLVAIEALGSCTVIATDKTGTLTVNQLTARALAFPGPHQAWTVTGEGAAVDGYVMPVEEDGTELDRRLVDRLCRAALLCNEAYLGRRNNEWVHHGDPVDVALLVLGEKAGLSALEIATRLPLLARIPYEPERRFAATLHRDPDRAAHLLCVKGAPERILAMCSRVALPEGGLAVEAVDVMLDASRLASDGFRVIAVADALLSDPAETLDEAQLHGLTLVGFVGIMDPPRPEALAAISACRKAGIRVCMVTGDHADTARAVARAVGIGGEEPDVVTGSEMRTLPTVSAAGESALWQRSDVFARVEPQQKLDIVRGLQGAGDFVAVTGDGVNDAPALANAHVGVAMGLHGTDVARENADIVLTDDNFASLVAGVEEGRIAYQNIRKVIFLLISTGAAEIVLFLLTSIAGLPLPLSAVQLLWLNLVTNGIQDVALAFDPAEGQEMTRPPRPPHQAIFDGLMVQRVALSAVVMGGSAFWVFLWMLGSGVSEEAARNVLLLLMVLFENVQAFNSRSETRSILLNQSPFRNPLLFFGIVAALCIHSAALYLPPLQLMLQTRPVSLAHWLLLLAIALALLALVETEKWLRAHWRRGHRRHR